MGGWFADLTPPLPNPEKGNASGSSAAQILGGARDTNTSANPPQDCRTHPLLPPCLRALCCFKELGTRPGKGLQHTDWRLRLKGTAQSDHILALGRMECDTAATPVFLDGLGS